MARDVVGRFGCWYSPHDRTVRYAFPAVTYRPTRRCRSAALEIGGDMVGQDVIVKRVQAGFQQARVGLTPALVVAGDE